MPGAPGRGDPGVRAGRAAPSAPLVTNSSGKNEPPAARPGGILSDGKPPKILKKGKNSSAPGGKGDAAGSGWKRDPGMLCWLEFHPVPVLSSPQTGRGSALGTASSVRALEPPHSSSWSAAEGDPNISHLWQGRAAQDNTKTLSQEGSVGLKWGVRSQVGITYRNGICCNPVWRELITNPSRTQLLPGHLGSITLISSPPEERIPALCRDFGFIPKNSWSRAENEPSAP